MLDESCGEEIGGSTPGCKPTVDAIFEIEEGRQMMDRKAECQTSLNKPESFAVA